MRAKKGQRRGDKCERERLVVYITPELKESLEAEANDIHASLSFHVFSILLAHAKKQGEAND